MLALLRKSALYLVTLLVGSGILTNAARTPPEEAVENWGRWLRFLGIDTVPEWVKTAQFQATGIAIGSVVVIGSLVVLIRKWKSRFSVPPTPATTEHFITMHEAATLAYETFRTIRGGYRMVPDKLSKLNPLNWCASLLVIKGIAVYGSHPPSRLRERIPLTALKRLHFENNLTELHESQIPNNPVWINPEVRREDLGPILEKIKKQYGAEA